MVTSTDETAETTTIVNQAERTGDDEKHQTNPLSHTTTLQKHREDVYAMPTQ
jgi:hypothetical protein